MVDIKKTISELRSDMKRQHDRHVSIPDLLSDRWDTARFCGFGEGSSCYNNVLIIGDVTVGKNCWIGPNVVLDGSGGLCIGDYVSISAGVHIYTHSSVAWSNSLGEVEAETCSSRIGDGVFIGPNSVIQMGVEIGDKAIIGALSFVNKNIPKGRKWYGTQLIN
jgi:acetyltransferase-like isoleucine patch superfamily enzyme